MSKKTYLLLSAALLIFTTSACSKSEDLNMLFPEQLVTALNEPQEPISILVKLDVPPFITTDTGEVSGVALMDDGKIVKYQTLKKGTTFVANTIVYESKWVVLETHPTTANEAQTILKLAGQGGFAKEYKAMKERYSALDLVILNR